MSFNALFEALALERDPAVRWTLMIDALSALGLTQINYAFLDIGTATRMDARGDPMLSTMKRDWLSYYSEHRYDLEDDAVLHVRQGIGTPALWTDRTERLHSPKVRLEAVEAGLTNGLLVPLAGPTNSALPGAGIMLGSSLCEGEFRRILAEHGMNLVALAHLFHAGSVGELMRLKHGVPRLSGRERDCLQFLARGMRLDAIAYKLKLARVTVDLHLRNARRKLKCKTSTETLARAILYQMIQIE